MRAEVGLAGLMFAACNGAVIEGDPDGASSSTGATQPGSTGAGVTTDAGPTSGGAEVGTGGATGGTSGGEGSSEGGEVGSSGSGTTGEPPVSLRYDEVRQKSAHNTFQRDEPLVDTVLVHRVRSLELDIHVGKTLADEVAGDWFVYHVDVVDDDTSCRLLSQCFAQIAAVAEVAPEHEVITIFVDLKDGLAGGHGWAELDARILEAFGPRALTPGEMIKNCAGATTLQAAVTSPGCGWPQLEEIRGRVMVVFTGGADTLADYAGADAGMRAGFVAPALPADQLAAHPEAVFVNLEAGDTAVATAVAAAGLVSRVWVLDDAEAFAAAASAGAHHLATNKINVSQDAWATTAGAQGWPFTCIAPCEAPDAEPGQALRVTADSGDLWGDSDAAVFVRWALPEGALALTGLLGATSSHVEEFIKNCVGVRAGDADDAAYFAVCRPADNNALRVQVRSAAGESTEDVEMDGVEGLSAEVPAFARVERDADGLCARGYGSADGVTWSMIAERCFAAPLVEVGVLAASNDAGAADVRVFGLTATPGGALLAADAAVSLYGGAVGAAVDGF
ncbi:MAG: hypothetical protein JNL82_07450 [Myxococcales bacterium]|nr:hypothetical protein [Myxococcales bacterium]